MKLLSKPRRAAGTLPSYHPDHLRPQHPPNHWRYLPPKNLPTNFAASVANTASARSSRTPCQLLGIAASRALTTDSTPRSHPQCHTKIGPQPILNVPPSIPLEL